MKRLHAWKLGLFVAALTLGTSALAQDGAGSGAATGDEFKEAESTRYNDGSKEGVGDKSKGKNLFEGYDYEADKKVSSADYVKRAEGASKEMSEGLDIARALVNKARESNDAVLLNCVNDKLGAMKGIYRISEDALLSLKDAMGQNPPALEKARYEHAKIMVSKKKFGQLLREAQVCAGAESTSTGTAETQVSVDTTQTGSYDYYYGDQNFFNDAANGVVNGGSGQTGDDTTEGDEPLTSSYTGTGNG